MQKINTESIVRVTRGADKVVLVMAPGTGTIDVSVLIDRATNEYVGYKSFSSSDETVQLLDADGLTLRITPTGDAEYAVKVA